MGNLNALNITAGYSDHTIGYRALDVAAAMGAEVLEFHFTDKKDGQQFRDHQLSLDSDDLRALIRGLDEIQTLRGRPEKTPLAIEIDNDHSRSFRRAVYPSRDILAGELLDLNNLCVLRPNVGIDAREYYNLPGRRARVNLNRHTPLSWQDIE
jgi:N-acetylneuraminate synthase/N,N'-diacetyllegionaminate synthase